MPKCAAGYAGLFGDIGECAVAIVLVQRIANGFGRLAEIAGAAVDQEDIHPAVVVIIEESAAGAQASGKYRLGDMAFSWTQ